MSGNRLFYGDVFGRIGRGPRRRFFPQHGSRDAHDGGETNQDDELNMTFDEFHKFVMQSR